MTLASVSRTWIRFLFDAFTLCISVVQNMGYHVPPRTMSSAIYLYMHFISAC
jgi:hypothetical protein